MDNNFGQFLSEKRREVGLTQKELANKLFVSESTISKWEKNKANPDISMISDIAEILKVSEHELLVASVDKKERATKADANKWRKLSLTWNLFFIISYALALTTCFICNLAVNKTLSWFWVVFSGLLLAMSFTTFPRYIKKYKLLIVSSSEFLCLMLLFLVCNIYSKGNWFWLATMPSLLVFIVVFLPVYISKYNVWEMLKKHSALICVVTDFVMLLLTLMIICLLTNGDWFFDFALPLELCLFLMAIVFVLILRYTKLAKSVKWSILTFVLIPFIVAVYFIVKLLCLNKFGIIVSEICFPNLLDWSNQTMISSNVFAVICCSILFVSILLLVIFLKRKNKLDKK